MARLTNRQMLEALYEVIITRPAVIHNPFSVENNNPVAPIAPAKPLPPQLNVSPEPGVEYPPMEVPPGYHLEYDWANHKAVLQKSCGPIGE